LQESVLQYFPVVGLLGPENNIPKVAKNCTIRKKPSDAAILGNF